jgi:hypothetical protein
VTAEKQGASHYPPEQNNLGRAIEKAKGRAKLPGLFACGGNI